jgi:hypothetical protein
LLYETKVESVDLATTELNSTFFPLQHSHLPIKHM